MGNLSQKQILELIEAGIQAPSADNLQPWTFRLIPDGFELLVHSKHLGKFFDANLIATKISCGALIENVVRFASAQGLETTINYKDQSTNIQSSDYLHVANLEFKTDRLHCDAETVRKLIHDRHTNRFLFSFNKKVPPDILSNLTSETQRSSDYSLISYKDKKTKNQIIRAIALADTIRFTHQRNHEEFCASLRLGEAASSSDNGLTEETLGLDKATILGLKATMSWPRQRFLNLFGVHYASAFRASWLPMKASSEILSIIHHGTPDYYEFGRVLESFWLRANQLGLSVQPLGALPLFFTRLFALNGEEFSISQKKKLSNIAMKFKNATPGFDPQTDQLVMVFRIGYSDRNPPRSCRKKVEDFIIKKRPESIERSISNKIG